MVNGARVVDETQIIASIVLGETHLFHELIRPYERNVYAMVFSMLQNEADAEDAAQEAFLKAFRNLDKFRAESKFSTWLILDSTRDILILTADERVFELPLGFSERLHARLEEEMQRIA